MHPLHKATLAVASFWLLAGTAAADTSRTITAKAIWNCPATALFISTDPVIPALTVRTNEDVTLNNCKFTSTTAPAVLIETTGTVTCNSCTITSGRAPAIVVTTPPTAPSTAVATLIVDKSRVSGKGVLIDIHNVFPNGSRGGVNLSVKNSYLTGLNPNVSGQAQDRFISGTSPNALVISNNAISNTAGIYIDGLGAAMPGPLSITKNVVTNINSRLSNGANGYQPLRAALPVQFVQLGNLKSSHNQSMEISWNQITNQPGQSSVEDNINIYQSQGTATLPLRITNNFIRGAYPPDMNSGFYTGGGINTDGPYHALSPHSTAFVLIDGNHVVDTINYGISISAGHHNQITNNRVIGINRLPSGNISPAANLGMSIWIATLFTTSLEHPVLTSEELAVNAAITADFTNNTAAGNYVAWVRADGQPNTYWFQTCGAPGACDVNTDGGVPALTAGNAELTLWNNKRTTAGVSIGPNWQ